MARSKRITRSTQLADREEVREQLRKVFTAVTEGFNNQIDRSDESLDWHDIYDCKWTSRQNYSGNSRIVVPLVHNGIEARKTRFLNTLFPQAGRFIDVTTEDGEIPHATMALLESYIERAELKTTVVPALLVTGDIEGQYSVCVTWGTTTRNAVRRVEEPIKIGGIEHPDLDPVMKVKEEVFEESGPAVDVIADSDICILPITSETVEGALAVGGSVTTIVRWSKSRIEELQASGEIDSDLSADILVEMDLHDEGAVRNTAKHLAEVAGIHASGKHVEVFRTWTRIKVDGKKRLVLAYYAGGEHILGCKLCPYWCDKADIISRPVRKQAGIAKGMSLVKPCADMQYLANDFVNMGADSGIFTLNPVMLTDPAKNPRVDSMVLDMMAVWETSPNDTKPLAFPAVYQHAFNIVQSAERYIMATLSVNAAMLPQSTGVPGRKRNQAEIAMEQQIDILSTGVEITAVEGLLTEVVQRFAEYDAQFRDEEITVRSYGELGVKVQMETVPPIQMGKRWHFRWFGVEAARTAQQVQQQISALNVIAPMTQSPGVAQQGYSLNLIPFIKTLTENAFGPRLAPEIFVNKQKQLSLDPELENSMLAEGFDLPVSPQDDDPKHMQAHFQAMQGVEDIVAKSKFAAHLAAHQQQMQVKQAAQAMQQMAQMMQGGGGKAGGGGAKPPQPGGQVAAPRQGRAPPGAVPANNTKGGLVQLPRRM